jgi:hypothetical protein
VRRGGIGGRQGTAVAGGPKENRMRKPLYFDCAPDRFSRTRALFADASRLQVRYASPDRKHNELRRDARGQWIVGTWRAFL